MSAFNTPRRLALVPGRVIAMVVALLAGASCALAQAEVDRTVEAPYGAPVRTDSPRDTLATFIRLSDQMERALIAYTDNPSFAGASALALLSDQMNALIDLEAEPAASRREIGIATSTYLMDIFGRIGPPDLSAAPNVDEPIDGAYRIPKTPLYILRIADGLREGEYLFSPTTVQAAPRFFRAVRSRPLDSALDIESFTAFSPQLTGPAFPPALVRAIPAPMKRLWLDTPLWKVVVSFLALVLAGVILARAQRLLAGFQPKARIARLAVRLSLPLILLFMARTALPYIGFQVNLSGDFAAFMQAVVTVLSYLAFAWLFWLGVRMLFEWLILSPRISDGSLDANLLRLVSGVIGIIGVVVILSFGGQAIGLPIMSVLAGLGIGGLAVALALRPTLENLVGGVMLYIDRPVRVGDFCTFGDHLGTVENIGVRSTTLRALNRTVIKVPNAQFADMQIVNWAHCDQMLVNETIGVRYETTADQLRFLLADLRRMLHAHPRIDSDTVRVRFAGYGESTLNIDIRVYVMTREWNDFFAVREDVFLRVYDIVTNSGTGFGFPSQTLYLARDGGLDKKRGDAAEAAVQAWRRSGRLPFPTLPRDEVERLNDTLDYPPKGSPEGAPEEIAAERLSNAEEAPASAAQEAPQK